MTIDTKQIQGQTLNTYANGCVACSGKLVGHSQAVAVCATCGGVHMDVSESGLTYVRQGHLVALLGGPEILEPMVAGEAARYFDVTLRNTSGKVDRVHGWMDAAGFVVQYG